jgi:hypothetical protein
MRNAPAVTFHDYVLPKTRKGSSTVDLRQWPVDEPPPHRTDNDHNDGDDPTKDSKNGSQVCSRELGKFECRGGPRAVQPLPGMAGALRCASVANSTTSLGDKA